jgi:hypothetical protein
MVGIATLTTALSGVAMLVVPVAAMPAAARGPYAGGVDMNAACNNQWGAGWSGGNDSTNDAPGGAFNWYCANGPERRNIDVNAYCSQTYGGAHADSQGGKKYDWGCYYN